MRRDLSKATLLFTVLVCGPALAGERDACPPPQQGFLARTMPVGGWQPYGGGLWHWWPRHCFPRSCAPDDYCRKPLPAVCWPAYPPGYIWAAPQNCAPCSDGPWDGNVRY
jgi:hypothetical protein